VKDNDLITLLIKNLTAGLTLRGYRLFDVTQSYQPTQQGIPTSNTVFIHKITDVRRGSPGQSEEFDATAQVLRRTTTEIIESSYQVSGSSVYDYTDPLAITPADLVKAAARVTQSPEFQDELVRHQANILRVGTVTGVDISAAGPGYEQRPVFDITINHTDVDVIEIPYLTSTIYRMGRV